MSTFVPQFEPPQPRLTRLRIAILLAWFSFSAIGLSVSISAQEKMAQQKNEPDEADVVLIVDAELLHAVTADVPVDGETERVVDNVAVVLDPVIQNDPQLWLLSSYARVNTALARRACKLSQAEEQQLALMNDVWISKQMTAAVEAPAKDMAAGIARFLRGAAIPRANVGEQPQQVVARVRQVIDKQIESMLSDEHREAYRAEREERDKFRSQALASVLVSALDARVYLSTEQRQRLEAALAQSVMKELYWQFYFQNQSYIPDFPKDILNKVLTKEQLDVLKGSQTHMFELAQIELQLIQEKPIVIER